MILVSGGMGIVPSRRRASGKHQSESGRAG
jgi:hypothetical protein